MRKLFYKEKEIRRIGFFGLGRTCIEMMIFFKKLYPHLTFVLRSDKPTKENSFISQFSEIYIGNRAFDFICEDVIFLSPSVRKDRFSDISKKTIVSSDAEYFFSNTTADTYVITGSDGKSTTTKLTSLLLADTYNQTCAIGNIGAAMTPYLESGSCFAAVCEMSSFQLFEFSPFCKRALITNISKNHLDWHKSYEEYIESKLNALKNAETCVFNADCDVTASIAKDYDAFSVYSAKLSFNELKSRFSAEYYIYLDSGYIQINSKRLLPITDIQLPGQHGIYNFLSAASMCADKEIQNTIVQTAKNFRGLSHRCEQIGTFDGIEFIDSSIDTSPQRTITTLSSFSKRLIIILGGKSKGLDFGILIPILKSYAKAIILTGETGITIYDLLKRDPYFHANNTPIIYNEDFDLAIKAAAEQASFGDTVILSPASTSYDRFSSFEERGEHFKKTIESIYGSTTNLI